ncbi:MAG: FAD-dependent oxidoreductase, partial [Polyangiaceae bacterium]|nr:FAD-dependent oxidoreductase [Polyangiaceae bacterium]
MLWNAAHVADAQRDAASYGFSPIEPVFDWPRFQERRQERIARLNRIYAQNLELDEVELIRGWGKLVGRDGVDGLFRIEVGERQLEARHVVLAPGGTPELPAIPGVELGLNSDDFFRLKEQPRRVAVVGAGYIAVELAGVLNSLGSDVSLIVRGAHALRRFDSTIVEHLALEMAEEGIKTMTGFEPTSLERQPQGLKLSGPEGRSVEGYDAVIFAIGRRPLLKGLGLESIEKICGRLERTSRGHIVTNSFEETTVADLYALGDVTGKKELTPVAIAAGRHLADRLYGGKAEAKLDYDLIPTVIFSHPPIGTVGLSEEEAQQAYGDDIKCYTGRFVDMYHSFSHRRSQTVMKLVTAGVKERVVGLHMIGRSADEVVQGFAVAMKLGATKDDFDRTVAIHPTAAEEFVTMR